MNTNYSSFCDDFTVEMYINTQLELPSERDTLLNFFERISKQFPYMTSLYRRENGDLCLESNRDAGAYSWVSVEFERLTAGLTNPVDFDLVGDLHKSILDLAPHMIGLSYLDINSLDLCFSMDFDFRGNHNEVIAEALYKNSPFISMLDDTRSKPISLSSGMIVSLDSECQTQAKIMVEPHSNLHEIKAGRFKDIEPITLYFTLRRYPSANEKFDSLKAYDMLLNEIQEWMNDKIIPNFVYPLTNAIAQRR